jgi:hypothetical protein
MQIQFRTLLTIAFATAVLAWGRTGAAQEAMDPPGFSLVTLTPQQTVRLSVVCFDHPVGEVPPEACHGELMLHDAAGNVLRRANYDLPPGRAAFVQLTFPGGESPRLGINPCVLPAPGGRAVPSVEVFDQAAGRVVRYANPVAARMSGFDNGSGGDPGPGSPPPDSPAFGMVTVGDDQLIRFSVACFDHAIGGIPPGPCRGEVMFHDASGEVLREAHYDVEPGQAAFLTFAPPAGGSPFLGINPCILPAPGGRAVPAIEVFDRATGEVTLLVEPAVARVSQFQRR